MTAFQHPRQLDNLRGNALNTNFRLGSGVVGRNRLKSAKSGHLPLHFSLFVGFQLKDMG